MTSPFKDLSQSHIECSSGNARDPNSLNQCAHSHRHLCRVDAVIEAVWITRQTGNYMNINFRTQSTNQPTLIRQESKRETEGLLDDGGIVYAPIKNVNLLRTSLLLTTISAAGAAVGTTWLQYLVLVTFSIMPPLLMQSDQCEAGVILKAAKYRN